MAPIVGAAFVPHPPILIPEIGRGSEREAAKTQAGLNQVIEQVEAVQPDLAVVLTPHGRAGKQLIAVNREPELSGDFTAFGHPEIRFQTENAVRLAEKLLIYSKEHRLPVASVSLPLDHGALVPLYFLSKRFHSLPVLHLSIGWDSLEIAYQTGRKLEVLFNGVEERILLLSSGDLSHRLKENGPYGFHPAGPVFDHRVRDAFAMNRLGDLKEIPEKLSEPAGQCGLAPFVISAGIMEPLQTSTRLFSYEGPYGVGYLCAFASVVPAAEPHAAVKLAAAAIREYLTHGKKLRFEEYARKHPEDSFLKDARTIKAGAFVSLHSDEKLRGCIGTIEAVHEHLGNEIISNAIQAATGDPRFAPVQLQELKHLDIKVDVLGRLEPVGSQHELDVQIYGVVVESGYRRGLLLPALEGVQTVNQQLSIACQKAGILMDEPFKIYRFMVERYQ